MQFSVIIPAYNVRHYLDACVKSILSQSFIDYEMLLIDDGSTDGSGEACDAWAKKDGRIRVFHQPNGGLAAARNAGIRAAVGEYLLFLDSDDYWHEPNGLELLNGILQRKGEPLDALLFGYRKVNLKTGKETVYIPNALPRGQTADEQKRALLAKRQYSNSACTKLIRRAFLREHHIEFPTGRKSEDLVYSRRVLTYMQNFSVYPHALLTYQVGREGSISTAFDGQNYRDILEQMQSDLAALETALPTERALGRAFWAEQACWFLGYLPMSGQPPRQTIRECGAAFAVLPDGLSRRTRMVRWLTAALGKTAAVQLLNRYLRCRTG